MLNRVAQVVNVLLSPFFAFISVQMLNEQFPHMKYSPPHHSSPSWEQFVLRYHAETAKYERGYADI